MNFVKLHYITSSCDFTQKYNQHNRLTYICEKLHLTELNYVMPAYINFLDAKSLHLCLTAFVAIHELKSFYFTVEAGAKKGKRESPRDAKNCQ